jgi:hypothetical protein
MRRMTWRDFIILCTLLPATGFLITYYPAADQNTTLPSRLLFGVFFAAFVIAVLLIISLFISVF